jgi:Putative lumazine-binding
MRLLGLALSLTLLFCASDVPVNAASPDDASLIRATVHNYIDGYYTGDAHRMQRTLHAHYLKHMIHGDIPMRDFTGPQLIAMVRSAGKPNIAPAQRREDVTVLDISGTIASAKLVAAGWVDYMTLEKSDGGWRILSVVQRIDD